VSRVEVVADADELAEAAARAALAGLESAIDAHESCTWVLTGGGTPQAAYRRLAQHDLRDSIEWGRIRVAMGDERCVPPSDPESNWGQAAEALLDHVPLSGGQRLRMRGELGAERAADDYEATLQRLPRRAAPARGGQPAPAGLAPVAGGEPGPVGGAPGAAGRSGRGVPRLDLVWIGVGPDGHCLSLFPGRPEVEVADRLVVPVHGAPKPPPDRVSLTLAALAGAERLLVLAAGPEKAEAVTRALAGDRSLPITRAVAAVERAGGTVTWLLDRTATGA
jgi:6-phosphogluconolactonase